MRDEFEAIVKYIIGTATGDESPSGINIPSQFHPGEDNNFAIARNLNSAFLISLSGESHPLYTKANQYLDDFEHHPSWKKSVRFYKDGIKLVRSEISGKCHDDKGFEKDLTRLRSWVGNPDNIKDQKETAEKIRGIFFPEGVSLCKNRNEKINRLREKRKIKILKLNRSPIADPAKEILFTSNILITVPSPAKGIDGLPVSPVLKKILKQVTQEEQMYWYDHPIPVGTEPEHNEVLYGLEGLDKAVGFEKQRGIIDKDTRVACVLSVSVTHEGLQGIARKYLEDELRKEKNIQHLDVYVLTESDTIKLIEDIFMPAAENYATTKDFGLMHEVIGVDGEYSRHYSFLKAIAAFWQVFIDPGIKGTFKIDLDQVFPQKELVEQSGHSAFEHFKTPLWGAEGIDTQGNGVELGMIAGALVNKKDIESSLFTPDVRFPRNNFSADELIFFSTLPQALSTEAEMMTRYTHNDLDGRSHCVQRIHVTGGTCGILTDSLRRYRPFTPTFIGRGEDQAYILSVLFDHSQRNLRYVHKDGLIMRHDKEAFAGDAIKMAASGKLISDYIRTLMFSYYARALPWSFEEIKDAIDPFTGCFVSQIPLTVVCLRFALKAASLFTGTSDYTNHQGFEFLHTGVRRLHDTIRRLTENPDPLIDLFRKEKKGWHLFYEILDRAEEGIKNSDHFALDLKEKANDLIRDCKINFERGG